MVPPWFMLGCKTLNLISGLAQLTMLDCCCGQDKFCLVLMQCVYFESHFAFLGDFYAQLPVPLHPLFENQGIMALTYSKIKSLANLMCKAVT